MKRQTLCLLLLSTLLFIGVPFVYGQDECADCPPGISEAEILAYPTPNVQQLYPDDTLLYDRMYQRVNGAVDIYDAPNGNIVNTLDAGFNFVTTQGTQDEWTMINPDQWVRTEFLSVARPSRFAGVTLPEEPLPYPFGWILWNVVPSRTPGAEPTDGDLALLRYTLVNLYSSVEVDGWRWYQVGVDQWVHQTLIGKYIPVERPAEVDTEKWVSVDLYEQVVIAYENEKPVFVTLVSSGLAEWPTNEGLFHVYVRYPRTIMSGAEGQEDFYYLEEVPWTQYFDGDIGLHGTYWHDGFGYRHSHGCVNLSITDSYWLYNWAASEIDFETPNDTGAAVYVYSSGQYK
ncbi:MAG TPA: L,D-transpeptidase [Oceanobacillus sp.]|nr:L,D-transpeptidase [Oceanobacillus sp.]